MVDRKVVCLSLLNSKKKSKKRIDDVIAKHQARLKW